VPQDSISLKCCLRTARLLAVDFIFLEQLQQGIDLFRLRGAAAYSVDCMA
jgi:hypothetical protein